MSSIIPIYKPLWCWTGSHGRSIIAELRQRAGLTQEELAERIGTHQPTVQRWEAGLRFPRGHFLQRLAEALGVRPADLISAVTAVEMANELIQVDSPGINSALKSIGLSTWRVTADSLNRIGVAPGSVVLVREIDGTLDDVNPGSIVVLEAPDGARLIRQFLPPSLVTTNRAGTNIAIDLIDENPGLRVVAVVVSDQDRPQLTSD